MARNWLGDYWESEDARCDEVRAIAEDLTGHPAALYAMAMCADADTESVSLASIDPGHHDALDLTTWVLHTGDHYMDSER